MSKSSGTTLKPNSVHDIFLGTRWEGLPHCAKRLAVLLPIKRRALLLRLIRPVFPVKSMPARAVSGASTTMTQRTR